MKLITLSSGSSGNCYALKSTEGETLLLECGITINNIIKGLNYDLSGIVGCVITHEHIDHSHSARKLFENGIYISCSKGTNDKLNLPMYYKLEHLKWEQIGLFSVLPFNVEHDANEPMNIIIYHEEMGYMIFITDTPNCPVKIDMIDHWLIEANHSMETLGKNVNSGYLHPNLANRIVDNHMSIDTCISILKENQLETTSSIVLCHLSKHNGDEVGFVESVAKATGIMPYIAKEGLEVELHKKN